MLLITIATAPSCQWSPSHEEQQRGEERAGPRERRHVQLLARRAVDEGADDRQHERAGDGGEAGQVERQRAGGQVQAEHVDRLGAGVVGGVAAAGGAAGDGDHVRREQHAQDGRVVGGVGPVVPVPRLLLAAPAPAAPGRRCRIAAPQASRHRALVPPLSALAQHVA